MPAPQNRGPAEVGSSDRDGGPQRPPAAARRHLAQQRAAGPEAPARLGDEV